MTEPARRPAAPPSRPRLQTAVYDRSTPSIGLLSDGLLHTAELLGLVTGVVLYADLRRRGTLSPAHARAGLFLGLGAFQLFDGVVDHKVLRTHQVRYGVELLPYDLAWNAAALVLLAIGAALYARAARTPRTPGRPESAGPAR